MKRYRLGWAAILWLALALRLWGLDQHNIWWDEGLTAWAARLPVAGILDWTAHDVHPPLYFLITRGWWLLVGDGAWGLRFPPALAGVLGVALAGGLGRALGGRRAGLLSALFLALSPFAVTWSQELRMYIWAAAAAAGALWAAVAFWRRGGWRPWLAYVLAVAAGLWTLYLSVVVLLVTNGAFLLAWWRGGRGRAFLARWIAAQAAAVALFAPWLAYALPRMMSWSSAEPFDAGFFVRLYATVLATGAAADLDVWLWPTVAVFLALTVGLVALLRRPQVPARAAGLVMLFLGLLLPAVLVYGLTALPDRIFYVPRLAPRYFLPLAACFYVLLAVSQSAGLRLRGHNPADCVTSAGVPQSAGLRLRGHNPADCVTSAGVPQSAGLRPCTAAAAGIAVVVAVSLAGLAGLYTGRGQTDQYLSLAATLEAHRRPGDAVLLYSDADWPLFAAHHAGPWVKVPGGMAITPESAANLLAPVWEGGEGLWLVTIPNGQQTDPERLAPGWLDARAAAQTTWDFGETSLTLYARSSARAAAIRDLAPGHALPTSSGRVLAGGELLGASLPLDRYLSGDTLHLALTWARPPDQQARLLLTGPVTREIALPAWPAAATGPTRQQADWPLLADLPPGRYRLALADATTAVELARFTLVGRRPIPSPAAGDAMRPLDVRLGDSIRLAGYDLPRTTFRPGEAVTLTLYWEALEPVQARYKVFTHLVGTTWNAGQGNFLWGQQDNEPLADRLPTTQWAPGALIADPYRIALDPAAPPGVYTVAVGMYGLVDGVRLPVTAADGRALGDAVTLGQITVR